jgi:outer membrane protein assembly factor BamB
MTVQQATKVWERSLPRTRGVEYILPTTTNLFVNSVPAKFHLLDINSGRIEENTFTTDAFPIFYGTSDVIYAQSRSNQLQAIDGQRGTLIWEVNLPEAYIQAPTFTDDVILLTTGERTFGKVCALERISGRILWCSELDAASNVAVAGDVAYYLTLDSQLKAVNPQTGEVIGEIMFTPSLLALDNWDLSNRRFYIAASEGFVFVYFGSGRQLFAFQFSSPLNN